MTALDLRAWPLPYEERLEPRQLADIDLVVIHCTELPDLAMAREYGERLHYEVGTGNSGHYYIDRDGAVLRIAPAWTSAAYWLLTAAVGAGLAFLALASVLRYAEGPAIVRVEGGEAQLLAFLRSLTPESKPYPRPEVPSGPHP